MKAVILAGGLQSMLSDEQNGVPKPMVELAGRPLLWHIMKSFDRCGIRDFIVCGGYKVHLIKEFFRDFYIYESDITIRLIDNEVIIHKKRTEDWNVTVVDTGLRTRPAERIKRVGDYLDDAFFVTYGDCLSNLPFDSMMDEHRRAGKMVTASFVKPSGREKIISITDDRYELISQNEKNAWVNGNCLVADKTLLRYLHDDEDLEENLLTRLSNDHLLHAFEHTGFWTAIETKRDLLEAEKMWNMNDAKWIKG